MDMSTRLEIWLLRRIRKIWLRFLGLFSKGHCFAADVIEAMERGDGTTTLAWCWDGEGEEGEAYSVDDLMADIDEAIRRAPSPMGIDEFFLDIGVYGRRKYGKGGRLEGQKLLHLESFILDRYYDWRKGDARERIRAILEENAPRPQAPLVGVMILPIGGAIASLCRQGVWRPVSPWMR